jgi:tryptophan synthase beta chain
MLTLAERLTAELGGAKIYLKREDLNHTGAHKINNTVGQALLARRMGKRRVIAETGRRPARRRHRHRRRPVRPRVRGVHGRGGRPPAGAQRRAHAPAGRRGAPVTSGTRTLKDATNEAIRDWVTNVRSTFYIIGSVVGPHPYPMMVRDLQSVIGQETIAQLQALEGRPAPDLAVACVGGGSNAIGLFAPYAYLPPEARPRLVGVEAAGHGIASGAHAASITAGRRGVLHGALMYLLHDDDGQVAPAHSVSAGLDYPGVGPEHAYYADTGIAEYVAVDDRAALAAFRRVAELEGIIPALETAHAFAYVMQEAPSMERDEIVVVNLSGRGDKDVAEVARLLAEPTEPEADQ